ncbi:lysM domain-containing protein ARB_05157 [Colletotrichum liriopes]|uniref:LysM domain-containing protein ARB_05157 n=1 Tax=Colletotrichum liriopes TaxID=708192 RepID=A0AA37GZK6_9PEZI|nr:lysM domain-containing protein ARB_05157 [Colletotrichum liriopes]
MHNSVLLLLAGLAASAVSEPIPRRTAPAKAAAVVRRQGVPDDCTFFDTATSTGNDCEYFASTWGITVKDFVAWNPSVGADCSGIKVGQEYCVERNWGIPPSETTTGSTPGPTSTTPSPVQEGIINTCTSYHKAVSGDDCGKIVAQYGSFVFADFLKWNPAVGETCGGLWLGYYYCVAVPGTSTRTTTAASVPTSTVPSPVQEGIINTCTSYHKAVSGDDCSKIVAQYGTFAFADFLKWNPAVGETCSGLWLGYHYCVAVPGTSTRTTTAAPLPTSTVPSPVQEGITGECKTYYKAVSGDDCSKIVAKYGTFSFADFLKWNPAVGSTCSGLWLGYNYCVAYVSGVAGTPTEPPKPTTTACTGPDPTQPGAVCPCQRWHKVASGNNCDSIQKQYGITAAQFNRWNPQVGTTCSTLWLGYNVCVSAA